MPTRDYLVEELKPLREEVERLRERVERPSHDPAPAPADD
jgi:hypothetical protein